jgi:hypothetical protein
VELLVATWTLRLTLGAGALVALVALAAGSSPVDAVARVALVAFFVTSAGRLLINQLETPEQRVRRLRVRRARLAGRRAARRPSPASAPSRDVAADARLA